MESTPYRPSEPLAGAPFSLAEARSTSALAASHWPGPGACGWRLLSLTLA